MRKNNYRINKVSDLKKIMANVINDYNNGQISAEKAKTLGYLEVQMLRIMEVCDLEVKLNKIEKTIKQNGGV